MRTWVVSFPGTGFVPGGDSGGATSARTVWGIAKERIRRIARKTVVFFIIIFLDIFIYYTTIQHNSQFGRAPVKGGIIKKIL
jgi:hypothetical protein